MLFSEWTETRLAQFGMSQLMQFQVVVVSLSVNPFPLLVFLL